MNSKTTKVWYASYGSNLLEKRFSCYIAGGIPKASQRTYKGCANKSLPEASKKIYINRELYFARKSKTWHGGGIGFIKPEPDKNVQPYGKMYLITADQFLDLIKQESRYEGKMLIDLEKIIQSGSFILKEKSWYGKLIFLGKDEGHPIFTFTNKDFLKDEINPPNEHYLKTIIEGLKATYDFSDSQIREYLEKKTGIKDAEIALRLPELIAAK